MWASLLSIHLTLNALPAYRNCEISHDDELVLRHVDKNRIYLVDWFFTWENWCIINTFWNAIIWPCNIELQEYREKHTIWLSTSAVSHSMLKDHWYTISMDIHDKPVHQGVSYLRLYIRNWLNGEQILSEFADVSMCYRWQWHYLSTSTIWTCPLFGTHQKGRMLQ